MTEQEVSYLLKSIHYWQERVFIDMVADEIDTAISMHDPLGATRGPEQIIEASPPEDPLVGSAEVRLRQVRVYGPFVNHGDRLMAQALALSPDPLAGANKTLRHQTMVYRNSKR